MSRGIRPGFDVAGGDFRHGTTQCMRGLEDCSVASGKFASRRLTTCSSCSSVSRSSRAVGCPPRVLLDA